ncbi:sperm-associated acrosin inhibitor-like [Rhinopithecus roxellana]|uniref:sperm-associated acrosin inhibitor-like n=1 Tax=Rhinopithecus roxellana TaxID=61622 RepID=UPI001237750D|nr:sperm-associated acrosin inhibitor-like [Rhinopithecus roxellana]
MYFFSSWIKAIFTIALAFLLHSETSFAPSSKFRDMPDCSVYASSAGFCTREMDPICATNGQTYNNRCLFCCEKLENKGKIEFHHYGRC